MNPVSIAVVLTLVAGPAFAQQCLHGPDASPEQKARLTQAIGAMRNVNNMEANQPGARGNRYLRHEELATSPFALKQTNDAFKSLNLTPGEEILPGVGFPGIVPVIGEQSLPIRNLGPDLGQNTEEILSGLLNMDPGAINAASGREEALQP